MNAVSIFYRQLLQLSFMSLLLCLPGQTHAQTDSIQNQSSAQSNFVNGKQYVVIRHDGVEYIGEILADNGHEILLIHKSLGKIFIPKYEIKNIVEIKNEKAIMFDEYKHTGPFTTRYSFTTNALPIKKGENYGMLNLFGPEAHIAVTDNWNVGLITSWIASPMILATKYSFKREESKVNFSVGSLVGSSGYLNNFRGYGGLHWANITIGSREKNMTIAGGYAYLQTGTTSDEPADGTYSESEYQLAREGASYLPKTSQGPVFSIAGTFKIGAKASFIFDSMMGYFNFEQVKVGYFPVGINGGTYVVSRDQDSHAGLIFLMPGIRFQKTDSKAFQISVAGVSLVGDINQSFPIPMCTWFYKF